MLRHVQCTYPNLSWLLVVAAALALAACGSSIGGDAVTGSPVAVSPSESELDAPGAESTFTQAKRGSEHRDRDDDHHGDNDDDGDDDHDGDDGDDDSCEDSLRNSRRCRDNHKVLVCHRDRRTLSVSRRALRAHLRHGDTRGRCQSPPPPVATCPCFSSGDINAAAATCSSNVASQCAIADPAFLLLSCDPGGNVPPGVLGIYLSQTATGGSCSREDVNGTVTQNGLTGDEYQACVDVISGSRFCP